MKLTYPLSFCLLIGIALFNSGCKEDEPVPLQAEVKGKLLAGEKGQSKNWKLISGTIQVSGGAIQNLQLDPCFIDNIFKFTNNDSQDYEATEGTTKCDPADPNVIERGNWALSLDGNIIIVLSDEIYSFNGLFSFYSWPIPGKVSELTDTSLKIEMIIKDQASSDPLDHIDWKLVFSFIPG